MRIRIILALLACSGALCAQSVGGGIQGTASGGGTPTGPAGGDLGGTYPNPTIATGKPLLNNIGDPGSTKTFAMGSNFLTFTFGATTGAAANMLTVQDTASNTGTGYVFTAGTASGSAAKPFQVLWQGSQLLDFRSNGSILLQSATNQNLNIRAQGAGSLVVTSNANFNGAFNAGVSNQFAISTAGVPSGPGIGGGETVTFSATPTFATTVLNSTITLTSNITSFTLAAGSEGQMKVLTFCQNGTGNFTVAAPANVHGFFTIGVTASKCSVQSFIYSTVQTAWLAESAGVINQ